MQAKVKAATAKKPAAKIAAARKPAAKKAAARPAAKNATFAAKPEPGYNPSKGGILWYLPEVNHPAGSSGKGFRGLWPASF